jgi:KaiC/GvpD/RAD55 family RecA-like ATPase
MREQDFELVRGELLRTVEELVVAEHAALHRDLLGEDWSPPHAYRWIRYESEDPVGALISASLRLEEEWKAHPEHGAVRSRLEAEEEARLRRALELAKPLGYS